MCCMSGSSSTALCARNAHITLYDITTWSWVNLVNPFHIFMTHTNSSIVAMGPLKQTKQATIIGCFKSYFTRRALSAVIHT